MGCDGGTIPKRDELVRTKKKPEQVCTSLHQKLFLAYVYVTSLIVYNNKLINKSMIIHMGYGY